MHLPFFDQHVSKCLDLTDETLAAENLYRRETAVADVLSRHEGAPIVDWKLVDEDMRGSRP
jgi:hypothetical protein